ncbi:hypothetical protein [Streptomyces sp. NPDC091879]|uniref:P-type ATPase n=1 Tax=Streptomyces sp. NPDC091879 TaxID=3366006 RepID=UPI003825D220
MAVILLNAGFAFVQEMQAEKAVEALAAFLPPTAHVVRDNVRCDIAAKDLVPGDILIVSEGDRVCADARIVEGTLTLDLSSLTGGRACMHTELGRIAALSQRVHTERSPLEKQVRRATRIIAVVAAVIGAAFLPVGVAAGLGWSAAVSCFIGLIVANVP